MAENANNWAQIAKSPAFVQLHRKKKTFLISLWVLGTFSYFLLPVGAAYAPKLFSVKILGRINFSYFFCLYQFVMTWAIALYYTSKSNNVFDPLTREVLELIEKEEAK
jgi:uncharacterized membrane protein (DUF485 family)